MRGRGGRGEGRAEVRRGRPGVGAGPGPRVVARRAGREGPAGALARALVRRLRPAGPQRAAQGGAAAVAQRGPGGAPRRAHQPPEVSDRSAPARPRRSRRAGAAIRRVLYRCQINPTQRHLDVQFVTRATSRVAGERRSRRADGASTARYFGPKTGAEN